MQKAEVGEELDCSRILRIAFERHPEYVELYDKAWEADTATRLTNWTHPNSTAGFVRIESFTSPTKCLPGTAPMGGCFSSSTL